MPSKAKQEFTWKIRKYYYNNSTIFLDKVYVDGKCEANMQNPKFSSTSLLIVRRNFSSIKNQKKVLDVIVQRLVRKKKN